MREGEEATRDATLIDYLAVLPCAHVRFADFEWQYAVYDVFHTRRPSQVTHALGMAPNTMTWLMLASLLPLGRVDGGAVAALVLAALYARYDRAVGLVLAPVLAAMWLGGQHILAAWGPHAAARTLALAAGLAVFQASGHVFEPVPPPWSGTNRFARWRDWLRTASLARIVTLSVMFPVGVVLEYWAAPRLLPVQAMMVLVRLGYQPAFRDRTSVKTRAFGSDIRFAIDNRLPEDRAVALAPP